MGILAALTAMFVGPSHAQDPVRKTKPVAPSTSVTSNSQSGQAITAGSINTLNQIAPTLVRGPLLEHFKRVFVDGARIRSTIMRNDLTDEQYADAIAQLNTWANATYSWLDKDVSPYAAERFAFRNNLSLVYSISGTHKPEIMDMRSNAINATGGWLQNLDMLMREPSLYPQN